MAQAKSKRSHPKPGNDTLVWFAPVSGTFLSPAREKNSTRRKPMPTSIFSIPPLDRSKKKHQCVELAEPSSPKVSCIGQVRTTKKDKKQEGFSRANSVFEGRSRAGSVSPARFFSSPGKQLKWASLFGSRKVNNTSLQSCGSDASPCLDNFPLTSRSCREGLNCGGFFAKSFVMLQECGHASSSHEDGAPLDTPEEQCPIVNKDTGPSFEGNVKDIIQCEDHLDNALHKQNLQEVVPFPIGNIKISVEVVPETWLPKAEDNVMSSGIQRASNRKNCEGVLGIEKDMRTGTVLISRDDHIIDAKQGARHLDSETQTLESPLACGQAQADEGTHKHITVLFDTDPSADNTTIGTCKEKNWDRLHVIEPYDVIVIGYELHSLSIAADRWDSRKQASKGGFELGRLSFKGAGTDSQWLNGKAEFIRSLSATSYWTVITLRRSKSAPSRPSH